MLNMRFSKSGNIEVFNENGQIMLAVDDIKKARELLKKENIMTSVVSSLKLENTPTTFNFKDDKNQDIISFMKI